MQFHFSFKHMDTSNALQEYATKKIKEKVEKFVTKAVEARVTFSVIKHESKTHLSFHGGDGFSVEVEHSSADMYNAFDHMLTKFETQLRKKKEKLKSHKGNKKSQMTLIKGDLNNEDKDFIDAEDIIKNEDRKRVNG